MIFRLDGTLATQDELKEFVNANHRLSFDVETNSKNPRRALCIGFSVANSSTGYYVCLHHYSPSAGKLVPTEVNRETASQILSLLSKKQLMTWNGAYDLTVVKHNFGIDLNSALYIDGMLLHHTIDENCFTYGLKETAQAYFGKAAASEQADLKVNVLERGGKWNKDAKDMWMADAAIMAKYGIQDGILTARLINKDLQKLQVDDLEKLFFEEVMPLYAEVTIPMEQRGLALNMDLLERTRAEILADLDALEQKILSAIEPHLADFNTWWFNKTYPVTKWTSFAQGVAAYANLPLPKTSTGKYSLTADNIEALPNSFWKSVLKQEQRLSADEIRAIQEHMWSLDGKPTRFLLTSKAHLKKLFFDTLKEKPLSFTDKGNPQVNDDFLQSMRVKYDWCEDLHVYNKLCKLEGTYITGLLEKAEDGTFYPSFFQHRTVSGRLSGDFQQLPRPLEDESEHELVIKYTNRIRCFFQARSGYIFVDADYNSAEPRVFAYISQEKRIKDIFINNYDFYSAIAIDMEKLEGVSADKKAPNYLGKVNKTKRQFSKKIALGVPYGLGAYKLQFELGISIKEAEQLVNGYLNAYPNLKAWMRNSEKLALENGYIKSEAGRKRRFPRLVQIYKKYGECILDDLELWKQLNEAPGLYAEAKVARRELKNYLNNAKNFQIQALVASIINRAAINIAKFIRKNNLSAYIVAQIHDQLVVEVKEEHKDLLVNVVQTEMEQAAFFYCPQVNIPADPGVGKNLQESKND